MHHPSSVSNLLASSTAIRSSSSDTSARLLSSSPPSSLAASFPPTLSLLPSPFPPASASSPGFAAPHCAARFLARPRSTPLTALLDANLEASLRPPRARCPGLPVFLPPAPTPPPAVEFASVPARRGYAQRATTDDAAPGEHTPAQHDVMDISLCVARRKLRRRSFTASAHHRHAEDVREQPDHSCQPSLAAPSWRSPCASFGCIAQAGGTGR